jgi:phosphoribosyl 1,2-cyclic phosphate phosphodiesterase
MDALARKFPYIFDDTLRPLPGTYKPEGRAHSLAERETVSIAGMDVTPVRVPHGHAEVFAYRIGDLAYVTDAKCVPPDSIELLRGARVLVVNALFRTPHPTHLSIPEAIDVAAAIGAERTYLTHLTHKYSHAELEAELPPHVRPAYDGLTITI